jgi:trk system potassium uptake protein TrkA
VSKRENQNVENGLQIIIVGCGKVGSTLVARLCDEGHDVTVIDKNHFVIQGICETYDVLGIIGNGSSYQVQMEAGIEDADLIIAVTDSDELNLLCCTIAKKVGRCSAIASVRNPDYSEELYYLRDKLGLSMIINPELEAANEIARLLRFPTALSINAFAKGQVEMIKFKLPEGNILAGKALSKLQQKDQILICAVERDGRLVIPDGNFILEAGDIVSFISTVKNAHVFFKKIGLKTHRVSNAMIIGGGKTSYYLAKQLIEMGIEVKIIELDMKRCEELSLLLDDAIIICGDGADEKLLTREGLDQTESFIPLTGLDEENILLTLHAKRNPNIKVITKVNRIAFDSVIDSLELGSVVYPKYITAETIIAYVRAKQNSIGSNIETLYHIFDDRAEAIEFKIEKDSPLAGIPLKKLRLKKNLLIASIARQDKVIIPNGDDKIQIGDKVVVVTMQAGFRDISDILQN